MLITRLTSEPPNIMIDNVPIKRVTKTKSLGIQIDQFLTWDNHLEEICKKASSGIGAIRRLKSYVSRESLISVYYMLWFNLILTTAALCGTQLVPRFQIEFRLYKIEQQGSYWVIEMSMVSLKQRYPIWVGKP